MFISRLYRGIMDRSEESEEYIRQAYLGYLRYTEHCARTRFDGSYLFTLLAQNTRSRGSRDACEQSVCFRPGISEQEPGQVLILCATMTSRMSSIAGPPD